MKTKTITVTCVVIAMLFAGCAKQNSEACKTCKARNAEGTVLTERSVCDEIDENSFREEFYRYNVTCN